MTFSRLPSAPATIVRRVVQSNRRDVVVAGTAAGLLGILVGRVGPAAAQDKGNGYDDALKKIMGEAPTGTVGIAIELPEIAENGNTVPFTLTVDSPMTESDFVKAVHVISSGNPQPGVATFTFSPLSGKASVSGRMRLGRTQEVIAVAALSNGIFLMTKRTVKVTIGGCGG
jgi:sulfur-oxidizing protein SoxY